MSVDVDIASTSNTARRAEHGPRMRLRVGKRTPAVRNVQEPGMRGLAFVERQSIAAGTKSTESRPRWRSQGGLHSGG